MANVTFTGSGATTRIDPDPELAGGVKGSMIPVDPVAAFGPGGGQISPDPATAEGQTIALEP